MIVMTWSLEYLSTMLWGPSENEKLDPLIDKVLSILNKSIEFQQLMNQHQSRNVKINYCLLTAEECREKNITTAALAISYSLFASEKNEILLNSTLPLQRLVRGTLAET